MRAQDDRLNDLDMRFNDFQASTKNEIEKLKDLISGKSLEKKLKAQISAVEDSVGELNERLDALAEEKELNEKVVSIEERVIVIERRLEEEINITTIIGKVRGQNVSDFVQRSEEKKDEIPALKALRHDLDDVRRTVESRARDIKCIKYELRRLKSGNRVPAPTVVEQLRAQIAKAAPSEDLGSLRYELAALWDRVDGLRKDVDRSKKSGREPPAATVADLRALRQELADAGHFATAPPTVKERGVDLQVDPADISDLRHAVRCIKYEVARLKRGWGKKGSEWAAHAIRCLKYEVTKLKRERPGDGGETEVAPEPGKGFAAVRKNAAKEASR